MAEKIAEDRAKELFLHLRAACNVHRRLTKTFRVMRVDHIRRRTIAVASEKKDWKDENRFLVDFLLFKLDVQVLCDDVIRYERVWKEVISLTQGEQK